LKKATRRCGNGSGAAPAAALQCFESAFSVFFSGVGQRRQRWRGRRLWGAEKSTHGLVLLKCFEESFGKSFGVGHEKTRLGALKGADGRALGARVAFDVVNIISLFDHVKEKNQLFLFF